MIRWVIFVIGWWLFITWIVRASRIIWFFDKHRLTKKVSLLPNPSSWPLVSVIVPARNEEKAIENCLRSLLSLDYPKLEIIAVDDRSEDKTGMIMDQLSREEEDERLQVIHNNELPKDWMGKQYAIHKAIQRAQGEFYLLTDGDVIFEKEALRIGIQYMLHKGLDHIALFPQQIRGGFWENAVVDFYSIFFILYRNPKAILSPSKRYYSGMGQYNLMTRIAYEKAGGQEAIRLKIPQDFSFGKQLKHSGAKQDFLLGNDLIRFKWAEGVKGFISILNKNGFASLNYSLKELFYLTFYFVFIAFLPYIGLFWFHDIKMWGYVLSLCIMHFLHGYVGYILHSEWEITLVYPFCVVVYLWAFWKSAFITLSQKGIKWRDRFYPLKELRDN